MATVRFQDAVEGYYEDGQVPDDIHFEGPGIDGEFWITTRRHTKGQERVISVKLSADDVKRLRKLLKGASK